jgi:hypothetical protein
MTHAIARRRTAGWIALVGAMLWGLVEFMALQRAARRRD